MQPPNPIPRMRLWVLTGNNSAAIPNRRTRLQATHQARGHGAGSHHRAAVEQQPSGRHHAEVAIGEIGGRQSRAGQEWGSQAQREPARGRAERGAALKPLLAHHHRRAQKGGERRSRNPDAHPVRAPRPSRKQRCEDSDQTDDNAGRAGRGHQRRRIDR